MKDHDLRTVSRALGQAAQQVHGRERKRIIAASRVLKHASKADPAGNEMDTLIFTIALQSGKFRSELKVPFPATEDERRNAVEQWLALMGACFKIGVKEADVVLDKEMK